MPSVFNQTKPKARKRHRCCECRGWIEIGERYEYSWGIWDGNAQTYKTCLGCSSLRDDLGKMSKCCVPFTRIQEELWGLDEVLKGRFDAIRIQRGAIICPVYQAEENEINLGGENDA